MEYTRDFYYNDSGPDVVVFQSNLIKLGYALPQFGSDGWYGKETEAAAKKCSKDNHWDHCSWGLANGKPPCPVWLQQRVDDLDNLEPSGWLPNGRGMWIQSMNAISGPAEAEAIINAVGLNFVIVQAHWQYKSKGSRRYNWPDDLGLNSTPSYGCTTNARNVIEKMRDLGVDVIPFSYPVPGKHEEVIETLSAYAEAWESPTVIIDPEVEWEDSGGRYAESARNLSARLHAAFPGGWGVSSYGAPWYHRSFPFSEFSSATYGLPQTYGITTFGTEEGYGRALSEWKGYGFRHLVNLYGTYSKTDSQMRQLLSVCASFGPKATAGWKWGSTSDVEWDHISAILPK